MVINLLYVACLVIVKCSLYLTPSFHLPDVGSIGDLDTGEENPPDDVSLSGEEGGASDLEDSAELDGCSPPSLTPLCSEGETCTAIPKS